MVAGCASGKIVMLEDGDDYEGLGTVLAMLWQIANEHELFLEVAIGDRGVVVRRMQPCENDFYVGEDIAWKGLSVEPSNETWDKLLQRSKPVNGGVDVLYNRREGRQP